LYGLYPGSQVSPYTSPSLFEAARNSLIYRGDMATGWSIGWKVNLWAGLLDGNYAYKIINNILSLADWEKIRMDELTQIYLRRIRRSRLTAI